MKIIVIGAGISGRMAASTLSDSHQVTLVEAKKHKNDPFADHHAVMRLRSDNVKRHLSCFLKPITVQKQVFHQGKLYSRSTPEINNSYSTKCYGSIGQRSVNNLGTVHRYDLTYVAPERNIRMRFGKKVALITPDQEVRFADGDVERFDACVNTIPLPDLLRVTLGEVSDSLSKRFKSRPIFVQRYMITAPSTVHRTIYFTGLDFPYRATVEGSVLIIESLCKINQAEVSSISSIFGLRQDQLVLDSDTKHRIGKILPPDEQLRTAVLRDMTNRFGIYALGRYAIWKPIRTDQVSLELDRIRCCLSN